MSDTSSTSILVASIHVPLSESWLETNAIAMAASVLPLVHHFASNSFNVLFVSCDSSTVPAARLLRLALGVFYCESVASGILFVLFACISILVRLSSALLCSRCADCMC